MIDLYYWPTPNGHKVAIFLAETALPYRLVPVNIDAARFARCDCYLICRHTRF